MPDPFVLRVDRVGVGPLGVHGEKAEKLVRRAIEHYVAGLEKPPPAWVDLERLTLRPPGWFFTLAVVQAGRAVVRVEQRA
jgi:hypothetical protein